MATKPKYGSGERFRRLEDELAKKKGVKHPAALAAYIGRKVHGKKSFQRVAAAGRKGK